VFVCIFVRAATNIWVFVKYSGIRYNFDIWILDLPFGYSFTNALHERTEEIALNTSFVSKNKTCSVILI